MADAIFSYQDNIPLQSCLRYHHLKGKGQEHVHASWPEPHVHDEDEKQWDHSVGYVKSMKNG